MKKILNEWRNFINETAPKHPRKVNPRNRYDRAATKLMQDLTAEKDKDKARLRWHIGRFVSHQVSRDYGDSTRSTIEFVNSKDPKTRRELISDIKTLIYLYSKRQNTSKYMPWTKEGDIEFYNDTIRTVNASGRIRTLLSRLGEQYGYATPSMEQIEKVFKYYVAPTNKMFWPEEQEREEEPKTSRFASQMKYSADDLARKNYELWLKSKKRKK